MSSLMKRTGTGLAWMVCMVVATMAWGQGSLTPPGAPAPMMKTLGQIEPRTPISTTGAITTAGSYYLVNNLTAVPGPAIDIRASDVVLDLNGFKVSSSAPNGNAINAIQVHNRTNVTVRNGHINGTYGSAFFVQACNNILFEDMDVNGESGEGDVDFNYCTNFVVRNCRLVTRTGINLLGSKNGLIENCQVASREVAIYLMGAQQIRVEGCNIMGTFAGVYLTPDSANCAVRDCTVSSSHNLAIAVGGRHHRIEGNVLAGGLSASGIGAGSGYMATGLVTWASNVTVINNTVSGYQTGISLSEIDGGRIEHNAIAGCPVGIDATGGENNLILLNSCSGGGASNFVMTVENHYGPVVTASGELSATGPAVHPWANFSY